jgi:ubiquinone/menaquinone biosynthesis C-methylase UbiE
MDEKTIEAYNKVAKDYDDETVDFWERFPRGFLDKFVSMVSGKVLDVGSGPGRDGLLLKDRGLEITCLDASQEMVNICLSKGLNAILGDFLKLPFDDQSFAGVGVALGRVGPGVFRQLFEADLLLFQIRLRGERFATHENTPVNFDLLQR